MTDYTVRELMDKALEGLSMPGEDITESVLAQAAHRQRRRRSATVLASTVAVGAVVGVVTVTGLAFPHSANGATAGPQPGSATLTAPPAAHPSATQAAPPPASVVSGLLPAGSGSVVKIKDQAPTPGQPRTKYYPKSRFDGTYLVTRNGLTAAVIIQSYNPHAKPAQDPEGGDLTHVCGETPASWDCQETTLPSGVQVLIDTEPPGAWALHAGTVNSVEVYYPDGRFIAIDVPAGTAGVRPTSFGPGWPAPPLDRSQLITFAENPVWFS